MLAKLIETLTGRDELERVAYKKDVAQLNEYLKRRKLLIPRKPSRFLDASEFTEEQLFEVIKKESEDLAGAEFVPWILDIDGKKRLPAFSGAKKMEVFSGRISQQIDKVFPLGGAEFFLEDITKGLDLDFVDLNPFSAKSWEICVRRRDVA